MLQALARMLGWAPATDAPGDGELGLPAGALPPGLALARGDLGMPAPLDIAALRERNRERARAVARADPSR